MIKIEKIILSVAIVLLVNPVLCLPAGLWEQKTADEIVSRALASLSRDQADFLKERAAFFRQGLAASPETVDRYAGFSTFDTTGYAADKLTEQIILLRDLYPDGRSPYFAYRLGLLARLLMEVNSPFATAATPEALRGSERFIKDVETHLIELKHIRRLPRVLTYPETAVKNAVERSDGWGEIVRGQYLAGRGYNVVSRMAASKSFNEAIYMLEDIFSSIGSGRKGKIDEIAGYRYYRDACSFYLSRGREREAVRAYRKAGAYVSVWSADRIDSLPEAIDRYELIFAVSALETKMEAAGIKIRDPVSEKMMKPFLSSLSSLVEQYMDSGEKNKARVALSLCLRERYLPEWTLGNLEVLYSLDQLKNLDVPENSWKIYLEANEFESAADRAYKKKQLWNSNEYFVRSAALYGAIPDSIKDLSRKSSSRIDQIIEKMRAIPPSALLSEELFQSAVDSIAEGDVDSAVRDLQRHQRWGGDGKVVAGAMSDAESLKLFMKGKGFYQEGEYEKGVRYFRRLVKRFPKSPFAGPAEEMMQFYESRKVLKTGRLILLLKGAYEASFLGERRTAFQLGDDILKSSPEDDLRDRAQLLIAVAWYELRQRGYQNIYNILQDLLRHKVLKEDNDKLVLKKKIDFYFGLKDSFPEIDLDRLYGGLRSRLNNILRARPELGEEERGETDEEEAAERAIKKAEIEIEAVEDQIVRGEEEVLNMEEALTLLHEADDLLDEAKDLFDQKDYQQSQDRAERAHKRAALAKDRAGKILSETPEVKAEEEDIKKDETLQEEASQLMREAETAVTEAADTLKEAEEAQETEFDKLRAELDKSRSILAEAKKLFEDDDYQGAKDKASEAIARADEVTRSAEDLKKEEESSEAS